MGHADNKRGGKQLLWLASQNADTSDDDDIVYWNLGSRTNATPSDSRDYKRLRTPTPYPAQYTPCTSVREESLHDVAADVALTAAAMKHQNALSRAFSNATLRAGRSLNATSSSREFYVDHSKHLTRRGILKPAKTHVDSWHHRDFENAGKTFLLQPERYASGSLSKNFNSKKPEEGKLVHRW
eukprot:CAMPEP_0169092772 /NCGR_PEP_ID=MMETSP1015-20121227/17082_1 /TAXON_ID=342587 /ORGANISM="Karlodinium micrum, Strain CCMP2283" /LENGTH=182 /DNA_ID=CAMNT_0009153369 /DNA_START=74 /DNA_END=620 /DNA_ORIENTATION=+